MCIDTATSRLCTVFFVTVCLWLSPLVCGLSPCVSGYHHVTVDCHNVSPDVTVCLWIVTMCLWLSPSVSGCHHVSLVVTMCLWLSPCVSGCHQVPLVVTMCLHMSLCVTGLSPIVHSIIRHTFIGVSLCWVVNCGTFDLNIYS